MIGCDASSIKEQPRPSHLTPTFTLVLTTSWFLRTCITFFPSICWCYTFLHFLLDGIYYLPAFTPIVGGGGHGFAQCCCAFAVSVITFVYCMVHGMAFVLRQNGICRTSSPPTLPCPSYLRLTYPCLLLPLYYTWGCDACRHCPWFSALSSQTPFYWRVVCTVLHTTTPAIPTLYTYPPLYYYCSY